MIGAGFPPRRAFSGQQFQGLDFPDLGPLPSNYPSIFGKIIIMQHHTWEKATHWAPYESDFDNDGVCHKRIFPFSGPDWL